MHCVPLTTRLPSHPNYFFSHYLPLQNSGPCNRFYCLGHYKNDYDDDGDDDDDDERCCLGADLREPMQ